MPELKISSRRELRDSLALRPDDAVGFTSGTFDLLHPGHIDYLTKAKELCDLLVVGVNSDSSVKSYKSPMRPYNDEFVRLEVVAALKVVDYAFLFSETNNNKNIEVLKPDVYIKAGDYTKDQLSSAPLVEAYGGSVEIIPFRAGYSTTDIVERIARSYGIAASAFIPKEDYERKPAVFLDRDGTICKHVDYLHEPEKFEFLPGALEGMKALSDAGFRLVIVTNQPGIGLGYFTKEDLFRTNHAMLKGCGGAGVMIDRIYFSPYSKADGTDCRKPGTALIDRAVEDLNLDLAGSYVIGDMTSDVQLAKNAGCKSVLVQTGKAGEDGLFEIDPDFQAVDLREAATFIIADR